MRGSVYRRGKVWVIVWDAPRGPDGRRRQRSRGGFKSRREAETALRIEIAAAESGTALDPTRLTVADYLRRWLRDAATPTLAPSSVAAYTMQVETYLVPALGGLLLSRLTALHVQEHYATMLREGAKGGAPLSPASVRFQHAILSRALRQAVRWRLIGASPLEGVSPPRVTPPPVPPPDPRETARLLISLEGSPLYLPVLLAVSCGLRIGELCALRWSDVDIKRGALSVRASLLTKGVERPTIGPTKTRRSRAVALPPFVVEALLEHRTQQARDQAEAIRHGLGPDPTLVFGSLTGEPLRPNTLRDRYHAACARLGLPRRRFHELRHDQASLLLYLGVHGRVVQERLGHSGPDQLERYTHVMESLQTDAATRFDVGLREWLEEARTTSAERAAEGECGETGS